MLEAVHSFLPENLTVSYEVAASLLFEETIATFIEVEVAHNLFVSVDKTVSSQPLYSCTKLFSSKFKEFLTFPFVGFWEENFCLSALGVLSLIHI